MSVAEASDRVAELRERLTLPGAVLSRADLALLGWPERKAQDAIFRGVQRIVRQEGYSRPRILVEDYLAYVESAARRPE